MSGGRLGWLAGAVGLFLLGGCQWGPAAGRVITIKANGGQNWFSDERAILDGDKVIVGSVAGTTARGSSAGDVQVTTFDLRTHAGKTVTLASAFAVDDHVTPVLLERPDGRYLAAFQKHDADGLMRWTISSRDDSTHWGPMESVNANSVDANGMCFSNLIRLSAENGGKGRVYNFARSVGYDPNYLVSDDDGTTFRYGGHLMFWENPDGKGLGRPYIKYASNHVDTIWLATTEDHPQDFNTGILAGFIRAGGVYRSDGTFMGPLSTTTIQTSIKPTDFTRVFQGGIGNVAYINDLKVYADGAPALTFSVRKDDGHDLRYWYARLEGGRWQSHEIAYAGSTIYMGEPNYAGLATLDPADPAVLYISTNCDPRTSTPLVSHADGKRHFEIFKGKTLDAGLTWQWQPITADSGVDNIRPLPLANEGHHLVLWLRGTMTTYKNYDLDIVALANP